MGQEGRVCANRFLAQNLLDLGTPFKNFEKTSKVLKCI